MNLLIIVFNEITIINHLKEELEEILNCKVEIIDYLNQISVRSRLNMGIHQLNGEDFLPEIHKARIKENTDAAIGITQDDLFVPSLNFIFGLADPNTKSCVISLARLHSSNQNLFFKRVVKEAIHELGHAYFGLSHCQNRKCIMTFSNSLSDTDHKGKEFCEKCLRKIQKKN